MVHPAALPPRTLLERCKASAVRRSGPGGQHRNKAHTGVVLVHTATGTRAEASERRSREQNLDVALYRLRVNLALAVRGPAPAGPSELWRSRVRGGRLAVRVGHDDLPALLAEALDVLAAQDNEVTAAAPWLGITPTQLVKLLAKEPRAVVELNARRAAKGLRALKA